MVLISLSFQEHRGDSPEERGSFRKGGGGQDAGQGEGKTTASGTALLNGIS